MFAAMSAALAGNRVSSLESLAAGCALCALHDSARAKITMQSAAFKNLSGLIFDRDQPDQEELVAEVRSSR